MIQFFSKKRGEKGFTLIELLVVIAIIGILAGIVLVALGGARDRAKDARIQADMAQIRTVGELEASDAGDYDDVCVNADIITLQGDMTSGAVGGTNFLCVDSVSAYCIEIQLNSDNWWCVDSTLVSASYDSAAPPACNATGPVTNC